MRRLLRELELSEDVRANAIFGPMLYTGCRVSDLVEVELLDLMLSDRSGSAMFRHGKGNKQRTVPLPQPARKALRGYIESRPPVPTTKLFIGERGPMTDAGIRTLCRKYSAIVGVRLHPHIFRHTFAKQILAGNGNDLISLAQVLGHEDLITTGRYGQNTEQELRSCIDNVTW